MRKYVAASLVAAMALSLCACGSTEGKITLADYKGLEVYESDLDVDEQYDSTINQFLTSKQTTEQQKTGKVKKTDKVNIDFVGTVKVDGKDYEFPNGSATGQTLDIANSTYITGFAEGLVGKKVGSKVTLNLKFPDDYSNNSTDADGNELVLAGKKVKFVVTINYKEVVKTPKYNDKFVKKYYGAIASTTKEFDEYIKEKIKINNVIGQVWEEYSDECKVDAYPKKEVESYAKYLSDSNEANLYSYYQTNLDTYLEVCSMSRKEWNKEMKNNAQDKLKQDMIVREIAKKEGLTITAESDNYKQLALAFAQLSGIDSVETLESNYGQDTIVLQLNYEAVQKFVYDSVVVKEGERPTEESTTVAASEDGEATEASSEDGEATEQAEETTTAAE